MTTIVPDPESIPDLTEIRVRPPLKRPSDRRVRKAEAALVRAEEAVRRTTSQPGPPLVVVEDDTVPHVRLGLAWATVTLGWTLLGTGWLAAWMAAVAFVATGQLARAWRRKGARPIQPVAMLVAGAAPLAALGGGDAITAVLVIGFLLTLIARLVLATGPSLGKPTRDVAFTVAACVPMALAASSVVLVRSIGLTEAVVFLAFVFAYDAASFVVGSGGASWWEGPAAGAVATLPVTLVIAAVLVNPFDGASPWLLGACAALLAPVGQAGMSYLLADVEAPAIRRLDSLVAMGPVWAWAAVGLVA